MTILTASEAANYIRTESTDPVMLMLLPIVDSIIENATGRDWAADATILPVAKAAAGILLVQWYDNPGQLGSDSSLAFGLHNVLSQLEAEALKYRKYQFQGLNGAGSISVPVAHAGDDVISLVGVYGASGSQASKFASEIADSGLLVQTSSENLSENLYVVVLKSPADDVSV